MTTYVADTDYNPPTALLPRMIFSPDLFDTTTGAYPKSSLPDVVTYPIGVDGKIPFYAGSHIEGCLPAGVMIRLLGGLAPVELINVGDMIAGYDEHSLEPTVSPVKKIYIWHDRQMCELETENGINKMSVDHLIFSKNNQKWMPTRDIQVGDFTLWEIDGKLVEKEIKKLTLKLNKETVYQISMQSGHIFVGDTLAAHNKTEFTCSGCSFVSCASCLISCYLSECIC